VMNSAQDPQADPSAIRGVILDYGDVISHPADPAVIAGMASVFQLPLERFRQLYGAFRLDYDRGTLSADEYWNRIAEEAGIELHGQQTLDLRRMDVSMWSRLNEPVLLWARELRTAGLKTAVLSNMHDDMVQHLRQDGAWTTNFDCLTLSSAIGVAKPDAQIFKHCLKCLQLAPHQTVFIDDREPNVRAAEAQGIQGIVAPTTKELRAKLKAIGFSPLPE
jgi:putative hydrolase of the HAD superfamily